MTDKWTDGRLDDLDERLDRLDARVEQLRRDVRDDIKNLRDEGTRQHDEQTGELHDVRDKLFDELSKVNDRIATFGKSFDDVVKHFGTRQLEWRKALLTFAGVILAALIPAAITLLVVIFFGSPPHP